MSYQQKTKNSHLSYTKGAKYNVKSIKYLSTERSKNMQEYLTILDLFKRNQTFKEPWDLSLKFWKLDLKKDLSFSVIDLSKQER